MKFPRPRTLLQNPYPDLNEDQPTILRHLVSELINPPPLSETAVYIDSTIKYVKENQRLKAAAARINSAIIANQLFFVTISFPPHAEQFKALVDTGASQSMLHT